MNEMKTWKFYLEIKKKKDTYLFNCKNCQVNEMYYYSPEFLILTLQVRGIPVLALLVEINLTDETGLVREKRIT